MTSLRVAVINANATTHHKDERIIFLHHYLVDFLLTGLSEIHFTARSYFKMPYYEHYHTYTPDIFLQGQVEKVCCTNIRKGAHFRGLWVWVSYLTH